MSGIDERLHIIRTLIVNAISAGVGLGLWQNERRNKEVPPRMWASATVAPYIEVIVPCRNEEANMLPLLKTLMAQHYPAGRWGVTIVDDMSSDHTAEVTREFAGNYANLQLIPSLPLRNGWTGKSNALFSGARHTPDECEWFLFVDADTRHAPLMLSSCVQRAMESRADLLSLVIHVNMYSFWERLLVPQVGELYTLLVGTMDAVNSGQAAAANGQFLMIRREAYLAAGTLPQVAGDVAEDRALAKACAELGYSVRLEFGRKLVSARVYSTLREMWEGYTKTLFWASGRSASKVALVCLALSLYAIVPPVAAVHALVTTGPGVRRRHAVGHALLQLAPMLALRVVVCSRLGIPPVYAATYPMSVAMGIVMLLYSWYRVSSGKGVVWKGRTYTEKPPT